MKECPKCHLCFDDENDRCPDDGENLFISNKCSTILSGRYILERRLGKGGMGAVFKAKHKFLKSLYAIKIISPEVVRDDPTLLVRFRQEAILAASIHHPNVIAVTDFGVENENTPYLVMEYIEGVCLDDFLRSEKRLSPITAFEILAPIALGVGEAHSKGITHRDLKPLNVMLKNGYPLTQAVKVLDFGLAKIKSTESFASLVLAKTTNIIGSPHYMSPEQWENENVDTRSDIYSLGVILFQMLAGEVPFKGNSIPAIMYQHLQLPMPSFASLGVSISPQIESVVRKALAKEQNDRYSTVEEFLAEYEKAVFNSSNQLRNTSNDKTVSFLEASFSRFDAGSIQQTEESKIKDFSKTYNLTYLNSGQKETLAVYFNQPKSAEFDENKQLEQEFIHAQNRVEAARTQISEADKLALEFNEAQKAAEEARNKFVQAQQKLEEDIRRRMQAEMESKLAAEREAREKAEAEASRLLNEVKARQEAEQKANALAKTALEAQQRAEKEHEKAEREARQRQLEEGTRRRAEEAALKLAEQVAEAKRKYEEAKKEAEYEAYYRLEAEVRRKKVEEEIHRIANEEAEKRKIAEAQAAYQIKEQASRLEKQALEAEQKANEARLLAESEAAKREWAEMARIKAEDEAKRLAEEIIEAQKRLEEAQQLAKYEAEKRALEETARRKAEESARSSTIENQQNVESIKKNLMSQIEAAEQRAKSESEKRIIEEEARKRAEESARSLPASQDNLRNQNNSQTQNSNDDLLKNSSPMQNGETIGGIHQISSGQMFVDTASSEISNTNQIPIRKSFNPISLILGLIAFLLVSGSGGFLFYYKFSPSISNSLNTLDNSRVTSNPSQPPARGISDRVSKKMILITGGSFQMGKDEVEFVFNDTNPRIVAFGTQYPAHDETVADFYIDKTEVTNAEYSEFVQSVKHQAPEGWKDERTPIGKEKFPVTNISQSDASKFAEWISKRDNIPCNLPTEAEWEYAARSGTQQNTYPWGNNWISGRVNIDSGFSKEVGTMGDRTPLGVEDMMGNVMEWTSSPFKYFQGFPKQAESRNIKSNYFAVRGASFLAASSVPEQIKYKHLLLTFRQAIQNDNKYEYLGFRLACYP